jgi:hypothetical protein
MHRGKNVDRRCSACTFGVDYSGIPVAGGFPGSCMQVATYCYPDIMQVLRRYYGDIRRIDETVRRKDPYFKEVNVNIVRLLSM